MDLVGFKEGVGYGGFWGFLEVCYEVLVYY